MTSRPRLFAAIAILGIASAAAAEAPSWVLLTNGNLLTGTARPQAGRVLLEHDGVRVWLEESQVECVAGSAEQAYLHLRSKRRQPGVEDHLRLASWCLRQGLVPQASRELLEARVADPRDRRVAAMQQRLMREATQPAKRSRRVDYAVRQASHAAAAPPAMTDEQIERLPDGVLEQFTRRIQPILLNNCTTGGCHQSNGEGGYQLDRSLLHGQADFRTTRANLAATLALLDHENPEQSPLLAAAQKAHAGRTKPAFVGRHAALEAHLVAWVAAACRPAEQQPSETAPASASNGGVFELIKQQRERERFVESVDKRRAAAAVRDEFDPAAFNRQR